MTVSQRRRRKPTIGPESIKQTGRTGLTALVGLTFKLDILGYLSRAAFVGFAMFPPNTETFVTDRVRLKFPPLI